ncbi:MAG: hypothetical protein AAFW60_10660, partial [Pseudomonadota bacterium]
EVKSQTPAKEETKTKADTKPAKDDKSEAKADSKPQKDDKKPAEADKSAAERDENGRFKSKAGEANETSTEQATETKTTPASDDSRQVISRFSKEAQAEWDNTPESVRNEATRAITELENGFAKHKERATKFADIEPFEALGKQYGLTIKGVLEDYAGMSRLMNGGPEGVMQALRALTSRHGVSLEELAADIMGGDLSEFAEKASNELKEAYTKINALQKRVGELEGVATKYNEDKTAQSAAMVEKFAAEHPRFQELAPKIRWIMQTGGVDTSDPQKALSEAYAMADQLTPAAKTGEASKTEQVTETAPADKQSVAQTDKAALSVSGGPDAGSNPTSKKGTRSARDALKAAMASTS